MLTLLATALSSCLFNACTNPGSGDSSSQLMNIVAEKAVVDTSMILNTLDLYRAKRYESFNEAFDVEVEHVHKLVLNGRGMAALSPEIGKLPYLASLDVAHNKLIGFPEELSNLHYLQGFYANGNRLVNFPEQILLLPLLAKVDLSENQISRIPVEIMLMDQLTRLSLDKNTITEIPVELYHLSKLSVLELGNNGLSEIPQGMANLKSLKKLDLSNNQLISLPKEISALYETLEELSIQGNQIPQEQIQWFIDTMPGTRIRF